MLDVPAARRSHPVKHTSRRYFGGGLLGMGDDWGGNRDIPGLARLDHADERGREREAQGEEERDSQHPPCAEDDTRAEEEEQGEAKREEAHELSLGEIFQVEAVHRHEQ